MPDDIPVKHEKTHTGGRYVLQLQDGPEAEMTYVSSAQNTITIDHTYVPNEYRGKGIAARLVNTAINAARESETKIVPQCSYVAAQFRRHPEWNDLLAH